MKKSVSVITENKFLFQKIYLLCEDFAEVKIASSNEKAESELILCDIDTAECNTEGTITLSFKSDACDVRLPSEFSYIESIIKAGARDKKRLEVNGTLHLAVLDGEKIALTELELKLLEAIISGGKTYVSRERLLEVVWGNKKDVGIVNVYVHYLREKLEKNGEKIILSSRGEGYKISERYI